MNKRLFLLLMVLMSLSLVGIILVQVYYIKNSVNNEKQQFSFKVNSALLATADQVEQSEYRDYVLKLQRLMDEGVTVDTTAIKRFIIRQDDNDSNETLIYTNGVLEENYKLSSTLFDIGLDSINLKRILNEREKKLLKLSDVEVNQGFNSQELLNRIGRIDRTDKILFETTYEDLSSRKPLHKRISNAEIQRLLAQELNKLGIDIKFNYAIYSNDLATKIHSEDFESTANDTLGVPIFENENSKIKYELLVNFPGRNRFIMSSIMGVMLLSIVFTTIIIIVFSIAMYQLIKQRKISEIKTDFINNMTHEFKTPIATINLALDAIKNPKIINDQDKVKRYLNMIKDENKRMHAQVENVLRISKLEKNELNISKEAVSLHDIIEDAMTHVQLIVENRQGFINTNLKADLDSVLANETHFTNVIVNILDNAIKYSPEAPEITISTENVGNNIVLKVADKGSGMSKAAAKRVFEKFYREHTGNIHNVKGHGLGLAYVKRIVDDHQGHISVESEKDKGSTFTIKLPLIS